MSLRLALLGVGYIGGSAALAAKHAGYVREVVGYDPDPTAGPTALRLGVVDKFTRDISEAVASVDIVLLAAPVCCLDQLAEIAGAHLGPRCLVMDVGSVKRDFVQSTSAKLKNGHLVGCHPMAGAEFTGVAAADPTIFQGRLCYLCPPVNTPEWALVRAKEFWTCVGCTSQDIDPVLHDRLMAMQSHLPHVAAFALAASLAEALPFIESQAPSITTSLRDTSRIAASSPRVWRDIFLANADELLPLIQRLGTTVEGLRKAVEDRNGPALEAWLAEGQRVRQRLVKE